MHGIEPGLSRNGTLPAPETLIRPLPDAIRLQRLSPASLRLTWESLASGRVRLAYDLDSLGRRPVGQQRFHDASQATVNDLDPGRRPYLSVAFTAGPRAGQVHTVAERVLPLAGAVNVRDIGGYETVTGQVVRWGQLYRSGHLSRLSPDDLRYLSELGLRLVCDLRPPREAARSPGPPAAALAWEVVNHSLHNRGGRWRQLVTLLWRRERLFELIAFGYTRVVLERNAASLGRLISGLAEGPRPQLWHCTLGKDRTGVAVALLLLALDVPAGTVVADYTLSNAYFMAFVADLRDELTQIPTFGLQAEQLAALVMAPPSAMEATIAYLDQRYGGAAPYLLTRAGVTAAQLERLRAEMVTTGP